MKESIFIFNNLVWYPTLKNLDKSIIHMDFITALKYAHKNRLCLPTHLEFVSALNYGYYFERELFWTSSLLNSKTNECFFSGHTGVIGSLNKNCKLAIKLVKIINRS